MYAMCGICAGTLVNQRAAMVGTEDIIPPARMSQNPEITDASRRPGVLRRESNETAETLAVACRGRQNVACFLGVPLTVRVLCGMTA
jgi:hypothetical protein